MAIAEIIITTCGSLLGVVVGSMTTYRATDKDRKIKRKEELPRKLTGINYSISDMKETFDNDELVKRCDRVAIAAEEKFGKVTRRTTEMSILIDKISMGLETIRSLSNINSELKRDFEATVSGSYQYEELVHDEFSKYGMSELLPCNAGHCENISRP